MRNSESWQYVLANKQRHKGPKKKKTEEDINQQKPYRNREDKSDKSTPIHTHETVSTFNRREFIQQ